MADQGSQEPSAVRSPVVVRVVRPPVVVRAATWIGHTVGRWHRRRLEKKNDDYVRRWKVAWSAGRDAQWAGTPRESVPHRRSEQREAWLAGWLWASTQPDRRDVYHPNAGSSRAPDVN